MIRKRTKKRKDPRRIFRGVEYRSIPECDFAKYLFRHDLNIDYENDKIEYKIEETKHYIPDFKLPNGIYIEVKGRFEPTDRKKHLLVRKQHPHLDIRLMFQNPRLKINKNSKTTYANWCDKNNIQWCECGKIPKEWINEQ